MAKASVSMSDRVIVIVLPPAKIISHVVHEDLIAVFDEKSGLFNKMSITDYTSFMTERKLLVEEKVNISGLFDQARTNAETQLKTFILSFIDTTEVFSVAVHTMTMKG